ncbi:hypothetical protein NIES2100_05190 [Calothrix sp. NIES-2100]|uniref:hypothetical protein n=1 Tax=Calothrix sp. NIES-2100 TaxID=1954172 RepID=UPI000B5EDC00|nr:hypothetical protein NIES2100_05190 [Calothrix sp. NIES-2100]
MNYPELSQEAIDHLIFAGCNPELYRFGEICKNNHEFRDSGYSIRYKNGNNCYECNKTRKCKDHVKQKKESVFGKFTPLTKSAINFLKASGKNSDDFRFGTICPNNHEFENSGYSIRYKISKRCIFCAINYRLENEEKIKKQQKIIYQQVTREKLGIQREYKNAELSQEATDFLIELRRKPELYAFGSICSNGHEFQDSGYSIRLIKNRNCLFCQSDNFKKYKLKYS